MMKYVAIIFIFYPIFIDAKDKDQTYFYLRKNFMNLGSILKSDHINKFMKKEESLLDVSIVQKDLEKENEVVAIFARLNRDITFFIELSAKRVKEYKDKRKEYKNILIRLSKKLKSSSISNRKKQTIRKFRRVYRQFKQLPDYEKLILWFKKLPEVFREIENKYQSIDFDKAKHYFINGNKKFYTRKELDQSILIFLKKLVEITIFIEKKWEIFLELEKQNESLVYHFPQYKKFTVPIKIYNSMEKEIDTEKVKHERVERPVFMVLANTSYKTAFYEYFRHIWRRIRPGNREFIYESYLGELNIKIGVSPKLIEENLNNMLQKTGGKWKKKHGNYIIYLDDLVEKPIPVFSNVVIFSESFSRTYTMLEKFSKKPVLITAKSIIPRVMRKGVFLEIGKQRLHLRINKTLKINELMSEVALFHGCVLRETDEQFIFEDHTSETSKEYVEKLLKHENVDEYYIPGITGFGFQRFRIKNFMADDNSSFSSISGGDNVGSEFYVPAIHFHSLPQKAHCVLLDFLDSVDSSKILFALKMFTMINEKHEKLLLLLDVGETSKGVKIDKTMHEWILINLLLMKDKKAVSSLLKMKDKKLAIVMASLTRKGLGMRCQQQIIENSQPKKPYFQKGKIHIDSLSPSIEKQDAISLVDFSLKFLNILGSEPSGIYAFSSRMMKHLLYSMYQVINMIILLGDELTM